MTKFEPEGVAIILRHSRIGFPPGLRRAAGLVVTGRGVGEWARRWPGSGLRADSIGFGFDRDGSLVDMWGPGAKWADSEAGVALSHDAQEALRIKMARRSKSKRSSRPNPSSRSPWPKPWKPWEKQAAHRVRVKSHRRGRGKTAFDDHHEVAVYELSKGEWQAQAIDHRHFRHVWFDEPATSVGNALSLLRSAAAAEGWPYPALVRRLSQSLTGRG